MRTIKSLFAKAKHSVRAITVISSLAVLVVVGSGLLVTHHVATQRAVVRQQQSQAATDKALRQAHITEAKTQMLHNQAKATQNTQQPTDKTAKKTDAPTTAAKPGPVKYSTSSDPRSTAYSLTPPKPSAAAFTIKITHAGQLKAGDMWFNNPDKDAGEKGYYGGDLIISPSVVTISRSGAHQGNLTITSPDGKLMHMAAAPWDDISPYMAIVMDTNVYASTGGQGVSLPMFVEMWNVPANGFYTFHISSSPVNPPTNDSWRYDGFITVNVVD